MTFKRILGVTILVAVVTTFVWERGAVAKLREQNESLRLSKEEADRLEAENGGLAKLREDATATGASAERSELLRRRNEARRLRAQKQELEKLRAENQRLATTLKTGDIAPRKLSEMEGYVAKETWANVGFAAPENTVQSLFWAISSGNLEQFVQCFTPESARRLHRQMEQQPDQFRKEYFGETNPFRKLNGFRIAERTFVAEGKMRLGIQGTANGAVMPLDMRRVGNEWKIDDD